MQLLPSSWFHLLRPQSLSYVCVWPLCVFPPFFLPCSLGCLLWGVVGEVRAQERYCLAGTILTLVCLDPRTYLKLFLCWMDTFIPWILWSPQPYMLESFICPSLDKDKCISTSRWPLGVLTAFSMASTPYFSR